MTRVLITGGTGFFGKSILDYFSRNPCDYVFTVLSRRGLASDFLSQINPSGNQTIEQIIGDVRSFDVGSARFDAVIHAATPARVDVPDDEMRSIIVEGTANAIRQATKCGASKFMMVSSGGVYGSGFTQPISEEDEPHPHTAYGQAKLIAEQMAVESGLHVFLPRCFAFVGRFLNRNAHFAIGNFIRDVLSGNDIVIQGDGSPVRSYLYADDLVEWLFAILERGESGRVYNVGSDEAISIRDLACLVRDALKSTGDVKTLGSHLEGAANCYLPDIGRIRSELGVSVKMGLREAIASSATFGGDGIRIRFCSTPKPPTRSISTVIPLCAGPGS